LIVIKTFDFSIIVQLEVVEAVLEAGV